MGVRAQNCHEVAAGHRCLQESSQEKRHERLHERKEEIGRINNVISVNIRGVAFLSIKVSRLCICARMAARYTRLLMLSDNFNEKSSILN